MSNIASVEAQSKGFLIVETKKEGEEGNFALLRYSRLLGKNEIIAKFDSSEEAEEYVRDNY